MSEKIRAKGITNQTAGEDLELDGGADNVKVLLAIDKLLKILSGLDEIFQLSENSAIPAVITSLIGTAASPTALHTVLAKAAGNDALIGFGVSTAPSVPEIVVGYSGSEGTVIVRSTGTKPLAIASVDKPGGTSQAVNIASGDANITGSTTRSTGNAAAGPSGDIEDIVGSASGGTRGSVKSNSLNIIRKLGDNAGATKWSLTDVDDVEVVSKDSNGTLKNVGGRIIGRTPVADANHSVAAGEYLIAYTSITATRTVTLPDPATIPVNTVFKINDESGSVTALIKITLIPAAGNIDGVASHDITNAYGTAGVYSNGTNYFSL